MALFDKLGETLANAGKDVSQKAKDLSGTAKLTLDIRAKEDQLQKLYAEIGRQYFASQKADDCAEQEEFVQVKELLAAIEAMKKELLELKGAKLCPRCGEEVQAADVYCKSCGAKIQDDDIVVDAVVREAPEEAQTFDEQAAETEPAEASETATEEAAADDGAPNKITEEAFED